MPNRLSTDLLELDERTTTGTGDPFDISELRTVADITVKLTAADGAHPQLRINIETSDAEDDGWRSVCELPLNGPRKASAFAWGLSRYIRAAWEVGDDGDAANITFSVAATAHVVYADIGDLGLPKFVVDSLSEERVSEETLWKELLLASSDADGFLSDRYHLPLAAWGGDISRHVGSIATYRIMCSHAGFQPEGSDYHFVRNHDFAFRWFKLVGDGIVTPPEVVDSSPTVTQKRWVVVGSGTNRSTGGGGGCY